MRKRIKEKVDERKVVIYARKSIVTHKGDSISNQEEYCKEYAKLHLNLPADYEYDIYEDEGKSGYYSDRPDFQRMIHDVERGKIRAIVCYKLDRISRRMSDLTAMINFLNKYNCALLISSNNLNTQDSNSKMMIQMLGMIAEFERDILTERITDNLSELAKDGRWMGGIPPTGFTTERSKYGTGKRKTAFTYLVPIPEEVELVKHIFEVFLSTRRLTTTKNILNKEGYKTKFGYPFRERAVSDIIRNPVYCTADARSYKYFFENDCNIYGDKEEWDGTHGVAASNRRLELTTEADDSTFLNPNFTSSTEMREMSEWIVAVGKHPGLISSKQWLEAQELRDKIYEHYSRPHRATNALLGGLMYCPICNRRLRVITESGRYTHGKPRFKYSCPNAVRKGSCTFQAIRGVDFDEYVVKELTRLGQTQAVEVADLIDADTIARLEDDENVVECNNDFTGKTVIPFATSSSSGMGESGEILKGYAGTGNWLEGKRFQSNEDTANAKEWAASLTQ
ncbi:MAG: recombinase family protein [Eubacteriales bacterium]|nr:recombinase family protein [Eubacteriales bacterium]